MFNDFFAVLQIIILLLAHTEGDPFCADGYVEESSVNQVLDLINTARQTVAKGEMPNGNSGENLPPAKEMPNVTWSCDVEARVVRELKSECPDTYRVTDSISWVLKIFRGHLSRIEGTELENVSCDVVRYSGEPLMYHNCLLLCAKTTAIGYAVVVCGSTSNFNYYSVPETFDGIVYEKIPGTYNSCTTTTTTAETVSTSAVTSTPVSTQHTTASVITEDDPFCTDGYVKEASINQILDLINTERQTVAKGEKPNGNSGENLPPAKEMPNVTWSCDMEARVVRELKSKCPDTYRVSDSISWVLGIFRGYLSRIESRELKNVSCDAVKYSCEPLMYDYCLLLCAKTTAIGYAVVSCNDDIYFGYYSVPETFDGIVYEKIPGTYNVCTTATTTPLTSSVTEKTSAASTTNTPPLSTVTTQHSSIASSSEPSSPLTSASSMTASTTATVTTEEPNMKCPSNYGMTDPLREAFLSKHNMLRSELALGKTNNGQTGKMCRKASKMPMLVYDCEMEKTAYYRATQCTHINASPPYVFENNCSFTEALDRSLDDAAQNATQLWWSELNALESGIEQIQNLYFTHFGINSFAKIASDLTTGIGCAIVHCGTLINAVCHYNTTLENGGKLYAMGPSCRRCVDGEESCIDGLCPPEYEPPIPTDPYVSVGFPE